MKNKEIFMKNIMIVAAHPDDEAIGCAAKIIRTVAEKGKVTVVYITDGEFYEQSEARREEAKEAMKIVRVKNLVFLKHKGSDLTDKTSVDNLIETVKMLIEKNKAGEVYVPAFEGGNYEHDITNYIVSQAAEGLKEKILVYEFPMYNNKLKMFLKRCTRRARRLSGLGFYTFPPEFPNKKGETIILNMSPEEMQIKKQMLETYKSQNGNKILLKCYMYPDKYRVCPKHDYRKKPHGIIPLIYETNTKLRFKDFKKVLR